MRSGPDQRSHGRYSGPRPPQQQQRAPHRGQTFDSNGPNLKIRGSAHQLFERYVALAREAAIGGDPIAAENLYQHAEHYFRIANANRDTAPPGTQSQPTIPLDMARDGPAEPNDADQEPPQPGWGDDRPGFV